MVLSPMENTVDSLPIPPSLDPMPFLRVARPERQGILGQYIQHHAHYREHESSQVVYNLPPTTIESAVPAGRADEVSPCDGGGRKNLNEFKR